MCVRTTMSLDPLSLCTHILQKASDLVHGIFFPYPRDLNIKYNKLRGLTFMMSTKSINFITLPPSTSTKINNRSIV